MITGEDGDQQILNAAKAVAKNLTSNTKSWMSKTLTTRYCSISEPHMLGKTPSPRGLQSICQVRRLDGKHPCRWMRVYGDGHYARLQRTDSGMSLLRALDSRKDQSYFLSQVDRASFNRVLFPLGELLKTDVAQREGTRNCPKS